MFPDYLSLSYDCDKIKSKYLIQVWEDVMKIIRNVKNVDVEKILWWRHHLNIPPPPYVTISHSFRVPPSPGDLLFEQPHSDFESQLTDDENSFQKSDQESLNEQGEQNVIRRAPTESPANGNKKLLVAPHRERKVVWSQNQVLSKIVKGVEDLAGAQIKRTKLMIEEDKKRDELFLKHKTDEGQRTREYKAK